MPREPEIWVWSGDFGLPTVFPDCLQIVTYMKMTGKPFKVVEKYNLLSTSGKNLPYFKHGDVELNDVDQIMNYLLKNFPIDFDLDLKDQSEAYAYSSYAKSVLYPCLQYSWWVDEKNYDETTRSWFAKSITMPFNFYYPSQFQKKAQEETEILFGDHLDDTELHHKINKTANSFFKDLSNRIGHNDYFFGKNPSSIDAVLYAYLAPILKFPLVNPTLTNYLKTHSALLRYIQKVSNSYYYEIGKKYIDAQEKKKLSQNQSDIQKKSEYQIQHKFLAVIIAVFAMFGYARSNGLLGKNEAESVGDYNIFEADDDYKI